jgi:hypothetical protein
MACGVAQVKPGSAFPVAVPLRDIVCVLPGTPFELSVIVSVALFAPAVPWGVNVMLIVHDAPAVSCPPAVVQESLLPSGKSVESVLAIANVKVWAPLFVSVAVCAELLVVSS